MELLYETEAVRLSVSDEGESTASSSRRPRRTVRTLGAGAVVIASGGLRGQQEMLTQYLGERACDLPLIAPGPANNRGEGIRMAMEVGADTAGQFDMFHAEPVDPRATRCGPGLLPDVYGILVNGRAERFFDEGRDSFDSTFEALGYEIWRNQEQTAYFVGDQTTLGIEPSRRSSSRTYRPSPPRPSRTRTPLGLDPRALARTVSEYNAAVGPERSTRTSSTARARGPRDTEVELGLPARLAAVHRVPAHLCDHVHVRRDPYGQLGAGREPGRHSDPRALRRR